MLLATKVLQLRPYTKDRFLEYVDEGMTADRAINNMLDKLGAPK